PGRGRPPGDITMVPVAVTSPRGDREPAPSPGTGSRAGQRGFGGMAWAPARSPAGRASPPAHRLAALPDVSVKPVEEGPDRGARFGVLESEFDVGEEPAGRVADIEPPRARDARVQPL